MHSRENDAPLLLDVSRLVWRRWTGTRATGIDRICLAWLEHFGPEAQAVVIHKRGEAILPSGTSQALFKLLNDENGRRDVARFRTGLAALAFRKAGHLRDRLEGRGRVWLNPGHTGLDSQRVVHWARRRQLRLVPLVHDLIPITHPQYCRDGEDQRHRRRVHTVLDISSGVVTNSRHTLDALNAFAKAEAKKMPPAVIAAPGTPIFRSVQTNQKNESLFVVLGTIEGRKNHSLLLSVWKKLIEKRAAIEIPKLLIVGRRGWRADDVFLRLDTGEFGDRVVELGSLDDMRLAEVLANARALLFPSLAEGYGIPLVEALAAGISVIASDLPVFQEIGQGVPDLLPPDDVEAWCRAICDYSEPSSERQKAQLIRLQSFRVPKWPEHFAQIDSLLRQITA